MLEVHDRVSSNLTRRTILSVAVVVRSPMSSRITELNCGSCPCRICDEGIAVRYVPPTNLGPVVNSGLGGGLQIRKWGFDSLLGLHS